MGLASRLVRLEQLRRDRDEEAAFESAARRIARAGLLTQSQARAVIEPLIVAWRAGGRRMDSDGRMVIPDSVDIRPIIRAYGVEPAALGRAVAEAEGRAA